MCTFYVIFMQLGASRNPHSTHPRRHQQTLRRCDNGVATRVENGEIEPPEIQKHCTVYSTPAIARVFHLLPCPVCWGHSPSRALGRSDSRCSQSFSMRGFYRGRRYRHSCRSSNPRVEVRASSPGRTGTGHAAQPAAQDKNQLVALLQQPNVF